MNVGIIGIGNMGSAMAARLLELGWSVAVRDLDAQRERAAQTLGATVWPTPAALAAHSDGVIVCVVDAQQTEDVLFGAQGAAPALAPGAAVMLCPTIAPADTERCAARLAAYGIDVIDAPMSGGPQRARLGQMSLLVACADAVFARHRVLLQALASRLFRIGTRPGDGARLKLVNNLLAAINLAGAAEALALAERVGLDMARTLEVIEHSSGQSWIATDRMRRAIAGDLVPRAHTTLLNKDTQLGLSMAAQAGFNAALGAQAAAVFAQACAAGWGDRDDACLLELMRNKPRRQ
jgi:3-hydroxyisobutyrate dehydrogenase